MPSFLSPFKWRLIAQLSNAYELQDIDLLDGRMRAGAATTWRVTLRPNVWTPRASMPPRHLPRQVFLGFSRFPEARSLTDRTGGATVRFNDMRFAGGLLTLTPGRPEPFTLTMQLAPDGRVVTSKLGW